MAPTLISPLADSTSPSFLPANIHRAALKARLKDIPQEPGVYRWLDTKGNVLYVGKAKNLRRRMRHYVGASAAKEGMRKRGLFEKMADLSITVTNTEMEALILEAHLIRSLRPRFNISLAKDSHYAFVKITQQDDFPSVQVTHRKELDGALYFGPFSNPYAQRRMVEILRSLFHFRSCTMSLSVNAQRELFTQTSSNSFPLDIVAKKKDRRLPCLDYHIEKCSGPCTGMIDPAQYRAHRIEGVMSFLRGESKPVLTKLIQRMKEAEDEHKFERAEELSFVLRYLNRKKQRCLFPDAHDVDIDAIGTHLHRRTMHTVILQIRGGNIVNELHLAIEKVTNSRDALSQFLVGYYDDVRDVPDKLLLSALPEDADLLEHWCSARKGGRVRLDAPREGIFQEVVSLAERNAWQKTQLQKAKRKAKDLITEVDKNS
jgi:excinuclease ABC subunit C